MVASEEGDRIGPDAGIREFIELLSDSDGETGDLEVFLKRKVAVYLFIGIFLVFLDVFGVSRWFIGWFSMVFWGIFGVFVFVF